MWQWLSLFRCRRCGDVRGTWNRALRSPVRAQLAICDDCRDEWERTGHRCARCWLPIHDRLQVGFVVESRAFLHVDCGGARVVGSPIAGPLGWAAPAGGVGDR